MVAVLSVMLVFCSGIDRSTTNLREAGSTSHFINVSGLHVVIYQFSDLVIRDTDSQQLWPNYSYAIN
jgi:hypothetical protein